MKIKKFALMLWLCSLFFYNGIAEATNKYSTERQEKLNKVDELIHCSIYYNMIGVSMLRGRENDKKVQDASTSYHNAADTFMVYAFSLSEALNLKNEAFKAKHTLIFESMGKEINNDFANLSILTLKYFDKCMTIRNNYTKYIIE